MEYDFNHPNAAHHCLSCGKPILWSFAICNKCEEVYGRSAKDWPAWLRFLWNDTQRTRRLNKRIAKYEYTESDLEDPDEE